MTVIIQSPGLERDKFSIFTYLIVNIFDILSFQTVEMVNTAMLTGYTQSFPLRIYSLAQNGHVTDITSQTTCHSGDEHVLKVSIQIHEACCVKTCLKAFVIARFLFLFYYFGMTLTVAVTQG